MSYRVCIPTAGTGSRLGALTKYINKSLINVANKPVLSHIIELFPEDAEFVIALGYKGHLVKEFLELAYPARTFFYADVDPYEGPGSGLGLSLLSCKNFLGEPFVFISCDTLLRGAIPAPDHNWMGYAIVDDPGQYRTLTAIGDRVLRINEKGEDGGGNQAYIGLAGMHDYKLFWDSMQSGAGEAISVGEVYGLRTILDKGIRAYPFSWCDAGNPSMLEKTREAYRQPDDPHILDKPNEAIWFLDKHVVKFSDDTRFIRNRVERAAHMTGYIPQLTCSGSNMYVYEKAEGKVLSDVVSVPLFERLLEFCEGFWEIYRLEGVENESFLRNCRRFYKDKTEERITFFYERFSRNDGIESINGQSMPTIESLLTEVDWEWLSNGMPGRFHGDLHFENIIWTEKEKRFVFLDWRQDFEGSLTTGDIYYDLAKLLHGLIISHELIVRDLFWVHWDSSEIRYDFLRKQVLVECEIAFERWLQQRGYDVKKTRVLTALIYLNIAGLHHFPYCLLLYALGKRMLHNELEKGI